MRVNAGIGVTSWKSSNLHVRRGRSCQVWGFQMSRWYISDFWMWCEQWFWSSVLQEPLVPLCCHYSCAQASGTINALAEEALLDHWSLRDVHTGLGSRMHRRAGCMHAGATVRASYKHQGLRKEHQLSNQPMALLQQSILWASSRSWPLHKHFRVSYNNPKWQMVRSSDRTGPTYTSGEFSTLP